MPSFDHALKELFQMVGTSLLDRLGGAAPREWLNVEMASTRAPRADLVAWLNNGRLFHLEFQSRNEWNMPWRMLEYYSYLFAQHGVEPQQVVLYLGNTPLAMPSVIQHQHLRFDYQLVDIRQFDGEELLASPHAGDKVLAILCEMPEPEIRVRRILDAVMPLEPEARERALRLLLILSVLRKLDQTVYKEILTMPVDIDPMESFYLRMLIEKGRSEGLSEGRKEGRKEGRSNGEALLRLQLGRRFGLLPAWVDQRLRAAREAELEEWALRVLTSERLDQIFS